MKKLMVAAAAAVMMSFAANAGQCAWGYWGDATVDHSGTAFTGGTALLYVLTGSGVIPTYDTSTGTWNMNGATLVDTSAYSSELIGWGNGEFMEVAGIDPGTTAGDPQAYLAIVLTETAGVTDLSTYDSYYAYALVGQGSQDVVEPSGPTYGTIFETYDTTIAAASDWKLAQPTTPPAPTPEPTTGLLVLLGVAGLALRRKQA